MGPSDFIVGQVTVIGDKSGLVICLKWGNGGRLVY